MSLPLAFNADINFLDKSITKEDRNTRNKTIILYSPIGNTDFQNMVSIYFVAKNEGVDVGAIRLSGTYDCEVFIANEAFGQAHVGIFNIGDTFNIYNGRTSSPNKIIATGTITSVGP